MNGVMMVQCPQCLWLFDECGTEVAVHKQCVGGDAVMPDSWWSSVLADCEDHGVLREAVL